MLITVIDYGSGNLKSAAKALEAAANNINVDSKIIVTSDPEIIKQSKKIILPGQGSFRDCYLGIKKISGCGKFINSVFPEIDRPPPPHESELFSPWVLHKKVRDKPTEKAIII